MKSINPIKSVYRIRRDSDVLFSKGGCDPRFSKIGKIWKSRGHLSNHLAMFKDGYKTLDEVYGGCSIIEYEIREIDIKTMPVSDWEVTPATKRKKELEEARLKQWRERK